MDSLFIIKLICFSLVFHCYQNSPLQRIQRVSEFVDYTGSKVIRVVPHDSRQLDFLTSLGNDPGIKLWLRPTHFGAPVDIMVPFSELEGLLQDLKDLSLSHKTMIEDVGSHIKVDEISFFSTNGAENPFFNDYQRYGEIQKYLSEKHKQNPKITQLSQLGKSVEGRSIDSIEIGSNLGSAAKEIIYIDGGMHAREWAAVSTTLYIIEHLIEDYNSGDPLVKTLLEKFDFFIVPVVNPDGYEYTHTTDRMWRKNRRQIPDSECFGTDLNRNYPFHWGGEGSSHDPCDETYAGPNALSEPESKALTKFILSNKNKIKAYITLHAYGQYFLYPWGWTKDNSPNSNELKRVADIGYKALHSVHKTKYQVGSPGQIMYVSQGSDDWAHGEALIPYVYCLEMRDSGENAFLLPKSQIIPTGEEVFAAIKAMAEALMDVIRKPNTNVSTRSGQKAKARALKPNRKSG